MQKDCIFCQVIAGKAKGILIWENEEFVAIENKYPKAPIHLLVMPKNHLEKKDVRDEERAGQFWMKMMRAVFEVVRLKDLDKRGYKLVNNGAGYNHLEHEHVHVIGGTKREPGGET